MGTVPSSPPEPVPADAFGTVFANVADAGQVQSFSGLSVIHALTLSPSLNIVNTLNINPRIAPAVARAQLNEQLNPGSFASSLVGTVLGMPFSLGLRGLFPEFMLTVPFGSASFTLQTALTPSLSPTLKADLSYRSLLVAFDGSFATSDFFRKAAVELAAASCFRRLRFGASYSHQLFEAASVYRVVADYELPARVVIGGLFSADGAQESLLLSIQKAIGKTKVAVAYQVVPRAVLSQVTVGFDREFTVSKMAASITGNGILTSFYQRQMGKAKVLSLVASANLWEKTHAVGIRITIQQ
jgi:hypothetical protein